MQNSEFRINTEKKQRAAKQPMNYFKTMDIALKYELLPAAIWIIRLPANMIICHYRYTKNLCFGRKAQNSSLQAQENCACSCYLCGVKEQNDNETKKENQNQNYNENENNNNII